MKPPICIICNKDFNLNKKGRGLIYFKETEDDIKRRKLVEEKGIVEHPSNAEWFCKKHYKKAKKLVELPLKNALKIFH